MKTYIYYIVFLLAAFVQPLLAQDAPTTKAQPDFPTLPYTVTYTAAPEGGTVKLFVPGDLDPVEVAPNKKIHPGEKVTLTAEGNTDYELVFGYPKVYCTDTPSSILVLTAVTGSTGKYTFDMPKEPITVEVKFQQKPTTPSSDARLKELKYKIGDGQPEVWIPVPGFTAGKEKYKVTLTSSTPADAQITLSGTTADAGATLPNDPVTVSGSGLATLTVTAENTTTTTTYEVNFVKAEAEKSIVTINSPVEGGTITVTDANGKVINSGDAVTNGTVLTLTNTAVAGYEFSRYTQSGTEDLSSPVTVTSDIIISAEFTPPTEPKQMEDLGTPAVTEETVPSSIGEDPIIIIPDATSLPVGTELPDLLLIKEEINDNTKVQKVKEDAKTAIGNQDIPDENMIPMEVTLVEVTTTSSGKTWTPVQPSDKVKVRIPYPEGVDKTANDFMIVHLKSDGSIDVYSKKKGNLTLEPEDNYMEITITSFSPFVVAYVTKSEPDPGPGPEPGTDTEPGTDPEPIPGFFTVTLPAVEGAVTDPVAGSYSVEAGENFRFFLTLDKDYDESQPVVTTSRNETIEPFGSTSAYIIENIQSAVTITISGVRKNTAVSNATLDSGLRIRTEPSALYIETDRRADIRIVSISGSTLASFEAHPGTTRHPLSPGIYIVKAENEVYKVFIK